MEQNNFLPSLEKNISQIKIESRTQASEKHPNRNEDAILIDYKNNTFGVFDGMGGNDLGDKASRMAKDFVTFGLSEMPKNISVDDKKDYLNDLLTGTNKLIIDQAKEDGTNMGTTAVVGLIHEENGVRQAIIASVGDSRAYLYRDGVLQQITIDDDMARFELKNDINKIKEVQKKLANTENPEEDFKDDEYMNNLYSKRNMISAHLGEIRNFKIQSYVVELKANDRIVFCSDGVTDNLTEKQTAKILEEKNYTADKLIDKAISISRDTNNPRNKVDDMSLIVVDMPEVNQDKEVIKNQFQQGDRVNVKRSNGNIDSDFIISFINDDKKVATVTSWKNPEEPVLRHASISELEAINKIPESIESAKNIPDLYRYLKSVKNIVGESESYSSTDLINVIDGVESGQYEIKSITRTDGLRDKVKELLKIE